MRTSPPCGRRPTSCRSSAEYTPLRRVGRQLDGPVPVPLREDAVVLGQRRRQRLLLLRLPGQGRRDHVRHGEGGSSTSPARSSGWPRKAGITLRYTDRNEGESRKTPRPLRRDDGPGRRLVPPAAAVRARRGRRPQLPPRPGPRRRRGAGVPDRLGARRLGRADPGAAARQGAGRRHRAGPPQQPRPAQRPLPGPHPLPHRTTTGATPSASAGASCPGARARATRASTRTPPRRRSTTSPRCSTGWTGPRPPSSPPAPP